MRPRFSIRTLLALTAVAAAACYGWIARPTVVANRFIAAIHGGDYAAAGALYGQGPLVADEFKPLLSNKLRLEARLEPRTTGDLFHGRRRIDLQYAKGSVVIVPDLDIPYRHSTGSSALDIQTPCQCGNLVANARGVTLADDGFPHFDTIGGGGIVLESNRF